MGCYSMGKQKTDRWMVGPGRLQRVPGNLGRTLRGSGKRVPCSLRSRRSRQDAGATSYLSRLAISPARAGLALEIVVGGGDVCHAHVGGVVFDFFAGAEGYYAQ